MCDIYLWNRAISQTGSRQLNTNELKCPTQCTFSRLWLDEVLMHWSFLVTKWHAFLSFCTRAGHAVADFADFETTLLLLPAHPCSPGKAEEGRSERESGLSWNMRFPQNPQLHAQLYFVHNHHDEMSHHFHSSQRDGKDLNIQPSANKTKGNPTCLHL